MLVTFKDRDTGQLVVGLLDGTIDDEGSTWLWVREIRNGVASPENTLYCVQIEQLR